MPNSFDQHALVARVGLIHPVDEIIFSGVDPRVGQSSNNVYTRCALRYNDVRDQESEVARLLGLDRGAFCK